MELHADLTQWEVRLRRKDQHHQRRLQPELAVDHSEADTDRHQRHRDAGQQLQRQRRQERQPQTPHRRDPVLVGHPSYGGLLRLGATEQLQCGQSTDHVGEVMRQYGECVLATSAVGLRRPADQRHEDRDQRESHEYGPGRDQVTGRHPPDHAGRYGRREYELWQVAGEVRVQVVESLGEQGCQRTTAFAAQPHRPELQRVLEHLPPQRRLHRGRGPLSHHLLRPHQQRPPHDHTRQPPGHAGNRTAP